MVAVMLSHMVWPVSSDPCDIEGYRIERFTTVDIADDVASSLTNV